MSKDDDDEIVVVERRLPQLRSVTPLEGFNLLVEWEPGTRPKGQELVDVGPVLFSYKVYAPLRDDPSLFRTVRVQQHRFGITWGSGEIDMGAQTISDLADETMTAEDFEDFMDRHGFTLDSAAAELGISRRMAAYYRRERRVPRAVSLACRYIDLRKQMRTA